MARDCRSKDTNKVKRQLNVLPKIRYHPDDEGLISRLENVTLTTSKNTTKAKLNSDEGYETPSEKEETSTHKTKYKKIAEFKKKHQLATPRYNSALLEILYAKDDLKCVAPMTSAQHIGKLSKDPTGTQPVFPDTLNAARYG
ncbi:hypothetical protein yc1106_09428 [Curvularia clavata]|uniref:Uncharacterized protein n=1 Tax=Curvularia clavata TaxID=95742 RepID=A0A9Q8ZGC4_CURCL|nr:hypothetical protein yc1106_09428 [Curvularia clavata]